MNYIEEYRQEILDGKHTVGEYIVKILDYLHEGLQEGLFFYDAVKADAPIDWIEAHCFHTEGPLAPGPVKLELWQKAFIASIYGIVDDKGLRQFREILLVISRKTGKSFLAACLAAYEFRNEEFGSRIFCIAPKLEQADIIYNSIWQTTLLDPEYKKLVKKYKKKDRYGNLTQDDSLVPRHRMSDLSVPATNSTVKKIAFSAKKSDGFNPSLCICDEIASWEGDAGLKQYEVLKSGMGARPEGILLSCTTSGYINDSIYDELMLRATRFLKGDSEERKLLPFIYMIDDIDKWDDIEELKKASPNLGVSVSEDYLREEIAVAHGSLSKKAEFLTKYCNVKQNSSLAWLDAQIIEKATSEPLSLEDFRGHYCVGGFDLSKTTDLTAACILIEKNEELYTFCKFWLPAEKIQEAQQTDGVPYELYMKRGILEASGDNMIDYHDVYDWFTGLIQEYEIMPLKIGYDRYSAGYLVQDMENFGFHMDDVYQGHNLHPVIQEMEGHLRDGRIKIGDNDLLKIHLFNSALKISSDNGKSKLVKIKPSAHIDGTAALLDALTVRQKWYGDIGEQLKNKGRNEYDKTRNNTDA